MLSEDLYWVANINAASCEWSQLRFQAFLDLNSGTGDSGKASPPENSDNPGVDSRTFKDIKSRQTHTTREDSLVRISFLNFRNIVCTQGPN